MASRRVSPWTNDLGNHRIVVRRDGIALIDCRIHPDTHAAGQEQSFDASRTGTEVLPGVFGVDAALNGMTGEMDLLLGEGELLACRNADLLLDQVDARSPSR